MIFVLQKGKGEMRNLSLDMKPVCAIFMKGFL